MALHFSTEVQLALPDVFELRALWSEYTELEQKATLPPLPANSPAGSQVQIFLFPEPPQVRYVFENPTRTRLVQIQPDRFVHNWRRRDDEGEYPHYAGIRPNLEESFARLQRFAMDNGYGKIRVERVEATYFNPIVVGAGSREVRRISDLLAPWSGTFSDSLLDEPSTASFTLTFTLSEEQDLADGILWISLGEAKRERDNKEVLLLRLTAHGKPVDDGNPYDALDVAHEWVIRGFKSLTTREMHRQWGGN